MTLRAFIALSLILCVLSDLFSQTRKFSWGKPSREDLELMEVSFEKDAEAVVLYESAKIFIGHTVTIDKKVRIKILSDNARHGADVIIPFHHKNGYDFVANLKAHTLNYSSGVKVEEVDVEKSEIHVVKRNDRWSEVRFAFPAVKMGSILEYTYSVITHDYDFLEDWNFDGAMPKLYSSVALINHMGIKYNIFWQGDQLSKKYKDKSVSSWFLENIPSIKPEPQSPHIENYREKISFQISHSDNSFHKLAELVLTEEKVVTYLNRKNKSNEIFSTHIKLADSLSDNDKIRRIFNFVSSYFTCDVRYSVMPGKSINKLYEDRKGSASDINMMLVALLREAGYMADPVLIKLRSDGYPYQGAPLYSDFSHMIACVDLYGTDFLLDANDPLRPMEMLDFQDLNAHAFVASATLPRWVSINEKVKNKLNYLVNLDLKKGKGDISCLFDGYNAFQTRYSLLIDNKNQEQIFLSFSKGIDEVITFDSIYFQNQIDKDLPLKAGSKINVNEYKAEMIYLPSIPFRQYHENPFIATTRKYPVEFTYPFEETCLFNIELPDDLIVEELPKSVKLQLLDNKGYYSYYCILNNNKIQVISKLVMNKGFIPAEDYNHLKQFFEELVAKQSEYIVLKKK